MCSSKALRRLVPLTLALAAVPAAANTYTVTTIADSGAGSLRAAITSANANPGSDTITFAIGSGPRTLAPAAPLPPLTDAVIIDATTQPGWSGTPLIRLDGVNAGTASDAVGLRLLGGASSVRGLIVVRFARIGIELGGAGGHEVYASYIGTDGTTALGSQTGVNVMNGSDENLIGRSGAGNGNVISGNATGVLIGDALGTALNNNYIGTNAAGTAAVPNSYAGVRDFGWASKIGAGNATTRNVISGNGRFGVALDGGGGALVRGNYLGLNAAGTAAVGNGETGVTITAPNALIGGVSISARNVISGNADAVLVKGDGAELYNNRIGTTPDGLQAIANTGYALRVLGGSDLKFGRAGAGNLVSGNGRGISLEYGSQAVLQGNVVGLNALQNQALPNGTYGGIGIRTTGNRIGGSAADEGNVVAGNDSGVTLYEGAAGNRIEGNFLGVNANLSATFGNGYANVMIYDGSDNVIGGTAPGAGNVISGSYAAGIFQYLGLRNAILGNRIFGNGRLDIEQLPLGPTPNDAGDADHGPDDGQNWPVLTSALAAGGTLALSGSLNSRADTDYRIEFFHSAACHPSGIGGGETLLGAATVHSDAAGLAAIAASFASAATAGVVTATATDADGNTSEFSPCVAVGAPGAGEFSIWRDPVLAYEDDPQLRIAVVRSHGFAGSASVRFATVNGSAAAPGDFAAVDTTLNFSPGEALKIVNVPLVLDQVAEGSETFRAKLQNPGNGATLGARADVEVSLFDHSAAYPFVRIGDAAVSEPAVGQTLATFVVSLSGTDHPVNLDVQTVDATARAGLDYVPTQALLTFLPGETSKTFSVPVLADNLAEGDEVFYVKVAGHDGSAFIADDLDGEGTIRNTGGSDRIFADGFQTP